MDWLVEKSSGVLRFVLYVMMRLISTGTGLQRVS